MSYHRRNVSIAYFSKSNNIFDRFRDLSDFACHIEKRILGDITVSVGAFLALLMIRVNCRGVRRSKNDAHAKKGQHKVMPDLSEPGQSLMSSTFTRTCTISCTISSNVITDLADPPLHGSRKEKKNRSYSQKPRLCAPSQPKNKVMPDNVEATTDNTAATPAAVAPP